MQGEKIYEGDRVEIYRMSPSLYFRRADLARGQCNNAYLVGATGVGVVDVSTLEAAQEFLEETDQLFHKPIRDIFLTHGHEDHMDGLPAFFDKEVTVYCSRRLFQKIDPIGKGYRAAFAAVDGNVRMSLSGGLEVELFTLPDIAHSQWDMFIRIPGEQTLCTGDAVVEYQTLYYHNASVETWIDSLKKLTGGNDKYVIPGHGPVYPYSYVGEVAAFLETVLRAAKRCFGQLSSTEIASISVAKINEVISSYFAVGDKDAQTIVEKAGAGDASREVRMVLWHLIREQMR